MNNMNLAELAQIADITNEEHRYPQAKGQTYTLKNYGKRNLPKTDNGFVDGNYLLRTTPKPQKTKKIY